MFLPKKVSAFESIKKISSDMEEKEEKTLYKFKYNGKGVDWFGVLSFSEDKKCKNGDIQILVYEITPDDNKEKFIESMTTDGNILYMEKV